MKAQYKDLRDFLNKVEGLGELKVVHGANWNLELGAIALLSQEEEKEAPAIIFDNIKGYPRGYRVLVNALSSSQPELLGRSR